MPRETGDAVVVRRRHHQAQPQQRHHRNEAKQHAAIMWRKDLSHSFSKGRPRLSLFPYKPNQENDASCDYCQTKGISEESPAQNS